MKRVRGRHQFRNRREMKLKKDSSLLSFLTYILRLGEDHAKD